MVADEPLTDSIVATVISAAFGVGSWFLGPDWRVDEREAMGPAKPLRRMIERAAKMVPGLPKAIKAFADPADFSEQIGSIVRRRTSGELHAREPVIAPAPGLETRGVQNGHSPAPAVPDDTFEARQLRKAARISGIVNE